MQTGRLTRSSIFAFLLFSIVEEQILDSPQGQDTMSNNGRPDHVVESIFFVKQSRGVQLQHRLAPIKDQ